MALAQHRWGHLPAPGVTALIDAVKTNGFGETQAARELVRGRKNPLHFPRAPSISGHLRAELGRVTRPAPPAHPHCCRAGSTPSQAAFRAEVWLSFVSGGLTSGSKELRGICWRREEQLQPRRAGIPGRARRLRGCMQRGPCFYEWSISHSWAAEFPSRGRGRPCFPQGSSAGTLPVRAAPPPSLFPPPLHPSNLPGTRVETPRRRAGREEMEPLGFKGDFFSVGSWEDAPASAGTCK